jgi:hypothetical protein
MDLLTRQIADYLERKLADEIEATLVREIQHRSNNLLAVIQTIATRSFSGSYTLAQAKEAFEARLQALARTNQQLTQSNWNGANLSEIVRLELQPYEHPPFGPAAKAVMRDSISVVLRTLWARIRRPRRSGLQPESMASNRACTWGCRIIDDGDTGYGRSDLLQQF